MTITAIVNIHCIYNSITGKLISITSFLESYNHFTGRKTIETISEDTQQKNKNRERYSLCYKKFTNTYSRSCAMNNTKKLKTLCLGCQPSINFTCMLFFWNTYLFFEEITLLCPMVFLNFRYKYGNKSVECVTYTHLKKQVYVHL